MNGSSNVCTVCLGSSDPFYIETYYIKWVTTTGHTVYDHIENNVIIRVADPGCKELDSDLIIVQISL